MAFARGDGTKGRLVTPAMLKGHDAGWRDLVAFAKKGELGPPQPKAAP